MTALAIRRALETALAGMSGALPTAYENMPYEPTRGTAYQAVNYVSVPDDVEIGAAWLERGMMQVSLFYPMDTGPKDAITRAEAIRSTFAKGLSFANGGVTTLITETPEIAPARTEDDCFMVPVKVRFQAMIGG